MADRDYSRGPEPRLWSVECHDAQRVRWGASLAGPTRAYVEDAESGEAFSSWSHSTAAAPDAPQGFPKVAEEPADDGAASESSPEEAAAPAPGPGKLAVLVQDQNGKAVEGADVAVNGTNAGLTDASGMVDAGERYAGAYRITAKKVGHLAPNEVVHQVEADTSSQATVLLDALQVTKVEPVNGTQSAPSKWWVNLDEDKAKQQGRKVEITAHVSPPRAGVKVCFILDKGAKNFDEAKLGASEKAKLGAASANTDANGVAKVELQLSTAGKDLFRVHAHLEGLEADKKSSGWVAAWRQLYYQLTLMKPSYSFSLGSVTGEYASHGIELSASSADVAGDYHANLETPELKTYATKFFAKKNAPFELHVILIDKQWDGKSEQIDDVQSGPKKVFTFSSDIWPFGSEKLVARWKKAGGAWSEDHMALTTSGDTVEVDLSGAGLAASDYPVAVQLKYKVVKGRYTGDATYAPNVFVAVGSGRSDASKSKTLVHEVGHGIGMVPTSGHTEHYSNANGGMGNHCRHGASPNQKSKAQGGTFAGKYSNGTCVMFAYSSEHYTFCATCEPFVLKAKMAKSDLQGRGW